MSEVKDPAIKLFGKTIQLLPDEKLLGGELAKTKQEDVRPHPIAEELTSEDPKTPSADDENPSQKTKEDPSETNISEEKTLKKPDKILPCPRCNSMDTKFCYYNNYNVNQPRHFCKSCQRYWTAGGTMRNVPVGSGRRKNKSSPSSHFRHIMVPEALQPARSDGGILTFGSDAPLCESMASALNLVDKSQNCVLNEFQGHERRNAISCGRRENEDVYLKQSSSTISNPAQKGNNSSLQESVLNNFQGSPPQLPCFPAPPWHSPWNQWNSNSPMPPPAFGPSGFPVSFYPVPHYWGCTLPSPWNMPWLSPQSPEISAFSSSPNSPNLGKHSRDGHVLQPSNSKREEVSEEKDSEKGVLIPKTLRINDPSEAAKSSIWSTLGIKNEKTDPINGGSLFKAFQPKGSGEKNHIAETSPVLQANPAAFSRSLNFQEST